MRLRSGLALVFFKVCENHTLTLAIYFGESVWTSHMFKKIPRKLLEHSCGWIREHTDATNLDVPDEFLHQWIYSSNDEYLEPTGFYLAVFSFGYLQRDLATSGTPMGAMRKVSVSLLVELFQRWQLKLALVELHRVTNLKVSPMPLFEFPADEKIEAWRVAGSST